MLACATAALAEAQLLVINGPEVVSEYYGESEAGLRGIFAAAVALAPSVRGHASSTCWGKGEGQLDPPLPHLFASPLCSLPFFQSNLVTCLSPDLPDNLHR
jgi:hypothetical protein